MVMKMSAAAVPTPATWPMFGVVVDSAVTDWDMPNPSAVVPTAQAVPIADDSPLSICSGNGNAHRRLTRPSLMGPPGVGGWVKVGCGSSRGPVGEFARDGVPGHPCKRGG